MAAPHDPQSSNRVTEIDLDNEFSFGTEDQRLEPTLKGLFDTESLKWIFVGGKGGVGKTTTSCSIAVELSKRRGSVLILSTDPAHNLSDAFGQKFTNSPMIVNGFTNLYAMEISSSIQENMEFRLPGDDSEMSKLLPELLSAIPGIDEALGFAELMNSVRTMNYSTIVFDTAPTGHTLRLISFPDLLEKGLMKLAQLREKMAGALNMMSSMAGGLIDEDKLHNKLDSLRALTSSVRDHFQDPTKTTFVCVCIPEFLSVYETERLVQELAKHNIDCSNIVVNQVLFPVEEADAIEIQRDLSEEALDEYRKVNSVEVYSKEKRLLKALALALRKIQLLEANFLCRRKMQSKYLKQIDELYATDFHVVPMPLQPQEVRGAKSLEGFANLLSTTRSLPIVS